MRALVRQFFVTLLLIFLLVEAKIYIEERTAGGQWIKRATYDYLQWVIALGNREPPRVTIVDISSVAADQKVKLGDKEIEITPRKAIYDLLSKIIDQCLNNNTKPPKAIGVDIDFSPSEGKLIGGEADLVFFQECLDLSQRTKVPIFLGIKRTQEQPSANWLYQKEFQSLAATVEVPEAIGGNEENKDSNITLMTHWLKSQESPETCPSMSAALAGLHESGDGEKWWLSWACEGFFKYQFGRKLSEDQFLVDWSSINTLTEKKVPVVEIEGKYSIPTDPERLADHIVLLGDMDMMHGDVCIVNGTKRPGVIVHACAAETLASGRLFKLTPNGRKALDLLFSVSILGALSAIRLFYNRTEPSQEVNTEWLHHTLTRATIVFIFVAGAILAWWARLVWDDFILVMLALMIHSPVEQAVTACFEKLPAEFTKLRGWWNKHALEPKQPS